MLGDALHLVPFLHVIIWCCQRPCLRVPQASAPICFTQNATHCHGTRVRFHILKNQRVAITKHSDASVKCIPLKSHCPKKGVFFVKMLECWSQIDWRIQQVSDCEMIQWFSNALLGINLLPPRKQTYLPISSNLNVPLQWIGIIQMLESIWVFHFQEQISKL